MKQPVQTADIYVMCKQDGEQLTIAQGKPAFVSEDHIKAYAEKDLSMLQLVPVKLTLLVGV